MKTAAAPFVVPTFIDRRSVRWVEVRSVQHTLHQSFCYRYPGPIYRLKHRLLVTPRAGYGGQELRSSELSVTPPFEVIRWGDPFGNTVTEVEADEVVVGLEFRLLCTLKNTVGAPPTRLSAEDVAPFRDATALTEASPRMIAVAREQRGTYSGALAFASTLNDWVHHAMRYGFGATDTRTPVSQALAGGVGLCQDYAHITSW